MDAMFQELLVPLDGSPLSETALPTAIYLASSLKIPLKLLRVIPSVLAGAVALSASGSVALLGSDWDEFQKAQIQETRQYLNRIVSTLPNGVHIQISIRLGDPAEEIVSATRESPSTLVVMSTHGRSGIARWVMGSVAETVSHRAAAPLLLVHPGFDRGSGDGS